MVKAVKKHRSSSNHSPTVLIFAGPNGSGKSTLTGAILDDPSFSGTLYINADEIAKNLEGSIPDNFDRNVRAAEIAESQRLDALQKKQDFAFETVMSTPEKVAFITQAKAHGYTVALYFVTTLDSEINVARVASRVADGGHSVRPDDVRKRYVATMALLPAAFEHADIVSVNDNSVEHGEILRVAVKQGGIELWAETDLSWVQRSLCTPYMLRKASRQSCMLVADGNVSNAEAKNGSDYTGRVFRVTKHHVLQLVNGHFLLHDRQLCANRNIYLNVDQTISYRYRHGKIVPVII